MGTVGVLTLLLVVAVAANLSIDVSHQEWKSCEEDYWRRGCRLDREGEGYNNFLAVRPSPLPFWIHLSLLGGQSRCFCGSTHLGVACTIAKRYLKQALRCITCGILHNQTLMVEVWSTAFQVVPPFYRIKNFLSVRGLCQAMAGSPSEMTFHPQASLSVYNTADFVDNPHVCSGPVSCCHRRYTSF